ncbi:uncharacterized protein RAG0_11964 [Rhynchosporium agropyri]|uniref:SANT domain-containing protein n=1 Tax=Rhynchosporium agropyri TaxID=914238 RepID=A0A1E1L6K1_9HELO|nr:uncharacterized protein RAG0_11964 [Rhynchosporium agropyri]
MDLDERKYTRKALFPDESSYSAFEISENGQSHDDDDDAFSASRAGSGKARSNMTNRSGGTKTILSGSGLNQSSDLSPEKEVFEDAAQWAANFKAPKLEEIKTPRRRSCVGKKRKAPKPPTETRVKRLKSFYSNDYRELLNTEIQEAASNIADNERLRWSQIGVSIWTAEEKAIVFVALARLGREDVRGIADLIATKSQHEVQEYINLLHQGAMEKRQNVYQLTTPADLPIAVEVSDECAAILERAGDALAAHQELAEEKVEKAKWGDSWLINQEVAVQMGQKRKQESGEEEMQEVFPAANLLELSNWIELSERIFMNPGVSREEDNWQTIAEPEETPAVRATAFEDFHSLAYNLTKRLVSTALFCCMSRLRARGFNKGKHAEVNADDVDAALKILRLKSDSHYYWCGVAKRSNLQVINDEYKDAVIMSHREVELVLQERHPKMRSRSASRVPSRVRSEQPEHSLHRPDQAEEIDSSPPDVDQVDSDSNMESEYASVPNTDEEFMSSPPPSSPLSSSESRLSATGVASPDTQEVAEAAQDAHTEAYDMYASQKEEIRLWNLLKQAAPIEFSLNLVSEKAPKGVRDNLAERENWRNHTEYVNEWEDVVIPVTQEAFARNRRRISRVAKRRDQRVEAGVNVDLDADSYDWEDEDGDEGDVQADEEEDLAATRNPEGPKDVTDKGSDDEHLQVESPSQQSPGYRSKDH